MPETLYPRDLMQQKAPIVPSFSGTDVEKLGDGLESMAVMDIPRTRQLSFFNVKPVPGLHHPKPWASLVNFVLSFQQPVLVIAVLGYCFVWYWWVLSVITMLGIAYPDYAPYIQGLLFIGLLLGTLFSEVFCSGRLSDWIVAKLATRNNGERVAEMRLWLVYPALLITAGK